MNVNLADYEKFTERAAGQPVLRVTTENRPHVNAASENSHVFDVDVVYGIGNDEGLIQFTHVHEDFRKIALPVKCGTIATHTQAYAYEVRGQESGAQKASPTLHPHTRSMYIPEPTLLERFTPWVVNEWVSDSEGVRHISVAGRDVERLMHWLSVDERSNSRHAAAIIQATLEAAPQLVA